MAIFNSYFEHNQRVKVAMIHGVHPHVWSVISDRWAPLHLQMLESSKNSNIKNHMAESKFNCWITSSTAQGGGEGFRIGNL